FAPRVAARMGLGRAPDRARTLDRLTRKALRAFAAGTGTSAVDERPTPWFDRCLVPFLSARFLGRPWRGFVNLGNDGLIAELPRACVVEVAAGVKGPIQLPPRVTSFLGRVCEADHLAYQAALRRDLRRLRAALEALPLPFHPSLVHA